MPATTEINTPSRAGDALQVPLAAATLIYAGTLVALDAAGRAVPAADTAGLRVIGRAATTVDNSAGLADALSIDIVRGVFRFANSTGSPVVAATVGKIAFVEDNQTVALASTHSVKAGRVIEVSSAGVFVDTTDAHSVPSADTITGAADLAALKTAVLAILQAQGLVK